MLVTSTVTFKAIMSKLISTALMTIISCLMIAKFKSRKPWLVAGAAITAVGDGLTYTLDAGTTSPYWIGYQALSGIGRGMATQVPIIANQASVEPSEVPSVTAMTLCRFIYDIPRNGI